MCCDILRADILRALTLCEKQQEEKKRLKKEAKQKEKEAGEIIETGRYQVKSSGGERWGEMFYLWDIASAIKDVRGGREEISTIALSKELDSMAKELVILCMTDYSPGHPPYTVYERR